MLSIGDLLFEPGSRRVLRGGEEIRLSPKAAAVLMVLAEAPGQVWTRDELLDRVWAPVHVSEEVLTHAIAELRRAFGDDFRAPRYLLTVHKSGYRLIPPVRQAGDHEPLRAAAAGEHLTPAHFATYLTASDYCERGGAQNFEAAIALFSELTRTHPDFAPAHAGLARALIFLATYYRQGNHMVSAALDHCSAAKRIAPTAPEAFATEAFIHAMMNDRERSAAGFQHALNLAPHDGETHYLLGLSGVIQGDMHSAALVFEHAAKLKLGDFRSLLIAGKLRLALGQPEIAARDFAAALPSLETRLAIDPHDVRALRSKARCVLHVGRPDDAYDLMVLASQQADPLNYQTACTMACAGQTDRALDVLEESIDLGWRHRAWLERDPDLDILRDHPRFGRICAAIQ